ncbi:hypothetical protein SDC9_116101 [bioreactor metagenome]|uniref:Uncharacterized protein n=1 Tax=bioreactor metagenome TaxID=1076179 RepID=A0A645BVC9_9ZZZZ
MKAYFILKCSYLPVEKTVSDTQKSAVVKMQYPVGIFIRENGQLS